MDEGTYWCDSGEAYGPGTALLRGDRPVHADPAAADARYARTLAWWQTRTAVDLAAMAGRLDAARGGVDG